MCYYTERQQFSWAHEYKTFFMISLCKWFLDIKNRLFFKNLNSYSAIILFSLEEVQRQNLPERPITVPVIQGATQSSCPIMSYRGVWVSCLHKMEPYLVGSLYSYNLSILQVSQAQILLSTKHNSPRFIQCSCKWCASKTFRHLSTRITLKWLRQKEQGVI